MRTSFTYDPFGRRTQKTVAGTSTTFLYAGANVAQEVIGGTNTANLLSGGTDAVFKRTDAAGPPYVPCEYLERATAVHSVAASRLISYTAGRAREPTGAH